MLSSLTFAPLFLHKYTIGCASKTMAISRRLSTHRSEPRPTLMAILSIEYLSPRFFNSGKVQINCGSPGTARAVKGRHTDNTCNYIARQEEYHRKWTFE